MMNTKKILILISLIASISTGQAQDTYNSMTVSANGNYYTIRYKINDDQLGRDIALEDYVKFHLVTTTEEDSVLKSSYREKPFVKQISTDKPRYVNQGFIQEMLLKLKEGDSATFLVNADDLFEAIKKPRPPFIKSGSNLKYIFKVLEIQNAEEVKQDKRQVVYEQKKLDEEPIAQYVAKNLPDAKKTYSGIWYKIHYQGEGDFATENDVVAIRYTGKLLDGTVFNSSDREGRLFEFPVNQGFVIKGLDEAILLLKQGAKATFIIPSYLAYGKQGVPNAIPPHAPLRFEVEFIDIVSRKIIIENKGQLKRQEKIKGPKTLSQEERLKQIEKDVKKKSTNIK